MQRVLAEVEPGASVQVENVPGAAGTIGLARFVQSERGNPHALLVTGLVMVSGVIINRSPIALAAATPIARLTGEFEVVVVPATSPFQSLRDLVDTFTANPGAVSWGGGSAGGTDDLLVRLLAEQVGLAASQVNYIAFAGGGAALAAVLGGQVTAGVSGYGEFAGQIEAGALRVLAVSAPARVAGIDAPTFREQGVPLDLANWRAVVAPPGLADAERDALAARVSRMAASEPWRQALAQNGWEDLLLEGPAFRQFLLAEQSRVTDVLARLDAGSQARRPSGPAITPSTVPTLVLAALALAIVALLIARRGSWQAERGVRASRVIPVSLVLAAQPVMMPTLGFVAASTLLFVATAASIRGGAPGARMTTRDAALGAAVAILLHVFFTRGLGVQLP